jgi:glycosyltransferase involved in cell wall biosynthesis
MEKAKSFSALRRQHGGEIHVTSVLDIPRGIDRYSLSAFFNPSGNFTQPLALRSNFASKLFPITFLTHGFSLHSMLYDGFLRLLLEGTYSCDSLICTSRASRLAMANILETVADNFNRRFNATLKYPGRLDVIPLCVDTAKFKPQDKVSLRRQLRLPQESIILLYLGYISALKADLLPLLLVFRRLIKDNPNRQLLLLIAGTKDASYGDALEKYVRDCSLSKHVRFIENFSDQTKTALTAAADIFVSPGDSLQESFGLTVIEAMACGIPQVVADWNGYRDTVSHGETGFLVPTYWTKCDSDLSQTGSLLGWEFDHLALSQSVAIDVDLLQSYLQTVVENEQLRQMMSERSRKRAETLFSFSSVVERYEELWRDLSLRAAGLAFTESDTAFAKPRYFESFRNHAGLILGEDSGLSVTSLGREASPQDLTSLLHAKVSGYKTIDPDLVQRTLDALTKVSSSSVRDEAVAGLTLGEFVESLTRVHTVNPDYIRRHVMWLMKHGFIKPVASQVYEVEAY